MRHRATIGVWCSASVLPSIEHVEFGMGTDVHDLTGGRQYSPGSRDRRAARGPLLVERVETGSSRW
jgi:hypothetical protein